MTETKRWNVEIAIDEHGGRTHAVARLRATGTADLRGLGDARCNPADINVPQIGDELATSRALADLAHRLLDTAAADIESVTHEAARLRA